jgi:hypothetical protein
MQNKSMPMGIENRVGKAAGSRCMAGEYLDDAVSLAKGFNSRGMRVSIGFIGEGTSGN